MKPLTSAAADTGFSAAAEPGVWPSHPIPKLTPERPNDDEVPDLLPRIGDERL